jgi:hypothetical protein
LTRIKEAQKMVDWAIQQMEVLKNQLRDEREALKMYQARLRDTINNDQEDLFDGNSKPNPESGE